MRTFTLLIGALIVVAVVVILNSFYTVRQDQQAIVLQLGEPVTVRNVPGTDEAGLYFKTPLVQQVVTLDRKNLGLNLADINVLASDQRRLVVDSFVRWRINDPLQFYTSLRDEAGAAQQLERFTESAIREALGDVPVPEIISGQRAELMARIRDTVNDNLAQTGLVIIDVRIRQADLPTEIEDGIFVRMQTARQQEAERIRAEGEEAARLIRATAEREATVIEAQAREQSEIIRGEGDARRNEIYADAYNADPNFFRFYRSLIACERSILSGTRIIVDPNNLGVCDIFSTEAAQSGRN
ncbi:MAG: protease modulator HflC [Pseudomonadota bacterium]